MEKIGNDDVWVFFFDSFLKPLDSGDIKEAAAVNRFDCNAGRDEFRSQFTERFQSDNFVFEILKKRQGAEKHIFAPAIFKRLDNMDNLFLLRHGFGIIDDLCMFVF